MVATPLSSIKISLLGSSFGWISRQACLAEALHRVGQIALAAAVDAGLVESLGGRVEFRRAVVGDAVREHAVPDVVRTMHRRAANVLASRAVRDDSGLERLASHLAGAGDPDGAADAMLSTYRLLDLTPSGRQHYINERPWHDTYDQPTSEAHHH